MVKGLSSFADEPNERTSAKRKEPRRVVKGSAKAVKIMGANLGKRTSSL